MNILFVTHYTGLGGANIAMLNLIQQYKTRNIKVYVVLPEGQNGLKEKLNELEIIYAEMRMPWWVCGAEKKVVSVKMYLGNIRGAMQICSFIKKWKIDIVHTNSTVVAAGALAARMSGCPHVWHLREDLSNYGWKFAFRLETVKRWFSRSERIIVISKACEEVYKKYLPETKIRIIYDGAQVAENYTGTGKLDRNIFHILYLGGMSESKGYKEVLQAAEILKKYGSCFKIWMPGCMADGAVEAELGLFIDSHELQENIEPLEYLDRKKLDQLRYQMDAFIMASYHEMFGLVTVEAMLSGVLVIASDTGANLEIISDGENGYLYASGDAEMLAKTIQKCMHSDNRELIESAYRMARERFSVESCAEKTIAVYEEILEKTI